MFIISFLLIIAPLTLFIHELGHSIGALLVRSEKIELFIGVGRRLLRLPLGRMSIHIHALFMLGGYTASERNPYYSKAEQIIISLFGPLLNGLLGILGALLLSYSHSRILLIFILFNLWLCIINLIPYRIGTRHSDGYLVLKTITARNSKNESI
ncbi:M50 family metallopeptidase [Bacillus sp. FJAT-49736]|uniref:site-2 protease family protein n=1 Tax=Bacillus sp. FJAT-49736 TaxID=2833582 RepID=UPI001BC95B8B|nr:M50 family metallopeptidase [Bacillus sp. FJAT-49736]MBS4174482.1 M50 family metallopeptidase [Bacillus sp. FJAT-49736]